MLLLVTPEQRREFDHRSIASWRKRAADRLGVEEAAVDQSEGVHGGLAFWLRRTP